MISQLTYVFAIVLLAPTIIAGLIAIDKVFILPSAILNSVFISITAIFILEYWRKGFESDKCVNSLHGFIAFGFSISAVTLSWLLFWDSKKDNSNIYAANLVTSMAACVNNIALLHTIVAKPKKLTDEIEIE